ncbi:MAG TPA: pirin family protein [Kofleriaceae bacterium]|nr:pirin family protein [Kofleriaceae bacterium]
MLVSKTKTAARDIIYTTRGRTSGPITRLVSPSDLGEVMKPFVFLDLAHFDGLSEPTPMEYLWHPHSGIATVTVALDGALRIADTTGADVVLPAGGIEWMRASNGVWHTGQVLPGEARAFQLWVALPPELENAPSASLYVQPEDVPVVGPARVILGSYGGAKSPIDAPPMTYLQVNLAPGEHWRYIPPRGHRVAWVAVSEGALHTPSRVQAGSVAVFEPSEDAIDFVAEGATRFVLGSAAPHPYELFLGNYSVHTSAESLRQGEEEIRRIGRKLRANGTLRYARPAVSL